MAASADFSAVSLQKEDKEFESEEENKEEDGEQNKNRESENNKDDNKEEPEKKKEETKIEVKPLVMKKIRLKKLGISCGIVSLGEQGPEVLSEGNAIYINQDHPIYGDLYKKSDLLHLHLLRLMTQEIVLMKKLKITAREAFDWQSKLLKDALVEDKK